MGKAEEAEWVEAAKNYKIQHVSKMAYGAYHTDLMVHCIIILYY